MNSGLSSKNDVIVQMAYLLGQRIALQTEILSFNYLLLAYFNCFNLYMLNTHQFYYACYIFS